MTYLVKTNLLCRCKKDHKYYKADLASTSAASPLEDIITVRSSRIIPSAPCEGTSIHTDSRESKPVEGEDSQNVKFLPIRAAESDVIMKMGGEEGWTDAGIAGNVCLGNRDNPHTTPMRARRKARPITYSLTIGPPRPSLHERLTSVTLPLHTNL